MSYSDCDPRHATLTDLLTHRAACQPNDLAFAFVADGDSVKDRLTYAELDRQARRIAGLLRTAGAGREPVLLLYPPGLDYISAFFGCIYAEAIAVPAFPPHRNRSLDRLRGIVADAGARVVLCVDSVRASLRRTFADAPELRDLLWLATDTPEARAVEPWAGESATPETLAFLQYTSGSTSAPKGVMLSHGNLMHNLAAIDSGFDCGPGTIGAFWLPLYHDMGLIGGVLEPLSCGGPSYLMAPATFLSSPIRWLRMISTFRATISGAPNFAYDLCASKVTADQLATLDLSSWRVAFSGAEPVRADTLDRFAETFAPCGFRSRAFYPCYGLAEATLIVTGGDAETVPTRVAVSRTGLEQNACTVVPASDPDVRTLVGCGGVLLDQNLLIVNPETGAPCPPDQPGEIWISGPSIAQGYWQRPDESAWTFAARTANGDGPFLRTGDLGFVHGGELYIAGRIKDLIILRGRNIYPQDIELTVERCHPAVRPACGAAFTVDTDVDDRLVVVSEVRRDSRDVPVEVVAGAIRQAVAEEHEVQVDVVVLLRPGSIPKTSSGKVQRHACKAGYIGGTLEVVGMSELAETLSPNLPADRGESPDSPDADTIRGWLVQRIAGKLGIAADRVDVREPLARYGLDSLTAVQLAGDLGEWLGRSLSPVLVYEYPTIEGLAAALSAGRDRAARPSESRIDPATDQSAIAVIGIGCRFPGADGPAAFWRLLHDGVDAISTVPGDRWPIDDYYSEDPTEPGTMNTRCGGFLSAVDRFDRAFFGISPREAERMDPQQRLLLEVAWEALEDAGQDVDRLAGRPVGVFVGISSNDYGQLQAGNPSDLDAYVGTGNALSIAANRLSYTFDFRGPSLAVDTACSSSLVAIHLACQSLRRGEAELAVAAGVNLILTPDLTVNFTRAGMMAPDGRCKAFDASANGYVRGEGAGVVVLKPLAQAIADGDSLYAVVRGSAVNQDGRSNGLTAPNRQAQENVLRAAYRDAGVSPADIDAVEAHGTGTALGDPIEALALGSVLADGRPADRPALLGSVKTNIGHLEAAAGVAGFIKMALALRHGELPPSLHFREANPHIPFSELPLRVATEPKPWGNHNRPARVGVSSFGFGGTNAHIVLEGVAAASAQSEADGDVARLIPLSARSPEALQGLACGWVEGLRRESTASSITDLAFTASARRSHHDHRLAIVARDNSELADKLEAFLSGEPLAGVAAGRRLPNARPRVAFVFGGQGPQWWGMGRQLFRSEPALLAAVERCDAALRPLAGWSVVDELLSQNDDASLDDTDRVQPILFALQVGLAELWRSWGVEPAAVVGHSLGEIAAAHVAGALSLADAARVVYHRSRLQQTVCGRGKMAAIALSAAESAEAIRGFEDRLAVAAINGPTATVWSGDPTALDQALDALKARDVFHRRLKGQVAFHSPQMEPLRGDLAAALSDLNQRSVSIPFYSTVTGGVFAGRLDADYWSRNLREPVRFGDAADSLITDGFDLFLELGPHPVLAEPLGQCLRSRGVDGRALPSMRRNEDERATILGSLGELYARGVTVAWDKVQPRGRILTLPTYAWQRERCWYEAARKPAGRNGVHTNGHAAGVNGNGTNGHASTRNGKHHHSSAADAWLVRPEWVVLDVPPLPERLSGSWLVVSDDVVAARRLPELLRERGADCVVATLSEEYAADGPDEYRLAAAEPDHWRQLLRDGFPADRPALEGVIYLAGLRSANADSLSLAALSAAQDRGCVGVLHLAQVLAATGVTLPRLCVVTRGAQAVEPDVVGVAQAAVWGLTRVIGHEIPDLRCTLIDLDPSPSRGDWPALLQSLAADDRETQLAWRDGRLYAARLRPQSADVLQPSPELRADATYLITGGLGGLGLAVAKWLVEHGARSLVLTGRRGPSAEAQSALADLHRSGAHVVVARADVADADQLAAVVADIDLDLPPLRGVVHAAGVLDDGIALQLTPDRVRNVLAPKVLGGWNLHALTAGHKMDFFVLFSSAAALLASPGQANYAAANAFLDALAHYRRGRNLPAVSVNWGPWEGVGMSAHGGRDGRLAAVGIGSIPLDAGLDLLGRLLAAKPAQVGVLPVDWSQWHQFLPDDRPPAYLTDAIGPYAGAAVRTSSRAKSSLDRAAVLAALRSEWPALLEGQLREQAARVLRLPAASLDTEVPLNNLGIDSLMAIELKNRIEADLGVTVPMVKFLEGPSVRDLAGFLADKLAPAEVMAAPPSAPTGFDPEAAELLARIDSLSDDQVDALLQEYYTAEKGN
jgi:acyl transferase domain-containing protein/acyl-CoA synthetase (AMP-forming)/AMP-acid ligase II/acyl carrier protein